MPQTTHSNERIGEVVLHPISLSFSDPVMEDSFLSESFETIWGSLLPCTLLVACALSLTGLWAEWGQKGCSTVPIPVTAGGFFVLSFVLRRRATLSGSYAKAHRIFSRVWVVLALLNTADFHWRMQTGLAHRLERTQVREGGAACLVSLMLPLSYHLMCFGWAERLVLCACSLSICLTSPSWLHELLAALAVGELLGYVAHLTARFAYERNASRLDRIIGQKERLRFDLMSVHQQARRPRRRQSSDDALSVSSRASLTSYGTDSEIAGLTCEGDAFSKIPPQSPVRRRR
mmetsp:Transcript_39781/g.90204  ORF Transcript_39781/g.90204 Transcript_39781/m.90204 type:complete len:289 (-) Transcript_39781:476-1342(-)